MKRCIGSANRTVFRFFENMITILLKEVIHQIRISWNPENIFENITMAHKKLKQAKNFFKKKSEQKCLKRCSLMKRCNRIRKTSQNLRRFFEKMKTEENQLKVFQSEKHRHFNEISDRKTSKNRFHFFERYYDAKEGISIFTQSIRYFVIRFRKYLT